MEVETAFDARGNLTDEFFLVPAQYPVYQLRISVRARKN